MLNSKAFKLLAIGVLAGGATASAVYALNASDVSQASGASSQTARYEADLMQEGRAFLAAIAQSADLEGKRLQPEMTLEKTIVTDLNGDGYAEVFGLLRQGLDPNSPEASRQTAQDATLYATVWLSYFSSNQPPTLMAGGSDYGLGNQAQPPYQIEAIADLNEDGTKEVIIHSRDDQPRQFQILEVQRNNTLSLKTASERNSL